VRVGAGRQTTVTDALGNEAVTAYYADSRPKYIQQKNKIADQTYVTYSRGSWYMVASLARWAYDPRSAAGWPFVQHGLRPLQNDRRD
jgi:hypothetical protein